jgi:hypothetical protein
MNLTARELPGLNKYAAEIRRRVASGQPLLEAADEVCARMWLASDEDEDGQKRKRIGKKKCRPRLTQEQDA